MRCVGEILFAVAGLAFSIFYGCYGVTILGLGGKHLTILSARKSKNGQYHWSWWVHQTWINFVGSLIGWAAAFCFVFCRAAVERLSLADGVLLLVAAIGMFGFLPWRLYNTPLRSG